MTREELYKKITNILFGNSCLSEDVHKCEFDGTCELHEKVKILEVVEEYSKQIRAEVIEEVKAIMHDIYAYNFYCVDDMCNRDITCDDCFYTFVTKRLKQLKEQK